MTSLETVLVLMLFDESDDLMGVHTARDWEQANLMSDTLMDSTDEIACIKIAETEVGLIFNERSIH